MMRFRKNILQLLLASVLFIGWSCETEKVVFKGPYYVRFTEPSSFARESFSKPITIQVHYAGPALAEDLTVSYSVGGSARAGVDYIIPGEDGKVVIPEGKFFGNIELQLINNSNNILRSQDIIFTLNGINNSGVKIGQGNSDIGKTFTFTIFDDCILGGNYVGLRSAFSIPVDDISITSEDCERYILSNWNIDIFNTPFDMDLVFIDKGDNTLTIPVQEEDNLPEDLATIAGTGIVDPVTREINMTIQLLDFEGQPEVSFTLIPD